jgi:hypothetical protein
VTDSPAKPLVPKYAAEKLKRGRRDIRDWTWRGLTLGSAKVKIASEDRATIGFVNTQADQIATAQNRRCPQWGMSPKDTEAMYASMSSLLRGERMAGQRSMINVDKRNAEAA